VAAVVDVGSVRKFDRVTDWNKTGEDKIMLQNTFCLSRPYLQCCRLWQSVCLTVCLSPCHPSEPSLNGLSNYQLMQGYHFLKIIIKLIRGWLFLQSRALLYVCYSPYRERPVNVISISQSLMYVYLILLFYSSVFIRTLLYCIYLVYWLQSRRTTIMFYVCLATLVMHYKQICILRAAVSACPSLAVHSFIRIRLLVQQLTWGRVSFPIWRSAVRLVRQKFRITRSSHVCICMYIYLPIKWVT